MNMRHLLILLLSLVALPVQAAPAPLMALPDDVLAQQIDRIVAQDRAASGIPGVSVAVVRGGRLIFERGYGETHLFGPAVTADTRFQAASLGKPMFAYAALRWSMHGGLPLDQPLSTAFPSPWLSVPPGDPRNAITMRHVLSHTSGLGNNLAGSDRTPAFAPGSRFRYSGVGFAYLQAAVTGITGQSLDAFEREWVFAPLGLHSADYATGMVHGRDEAMGHLPALPVLGAVAVAILLLGGIIIGGWILAMRWRRRSWQRPGQTLVLGTIGGATLVVAVAIVVMAGSALGGAVAMGGVACVAALIVAYLLAAHWLPRSWRGLLGSMACAAALVAALLSILQLPVPPARPAGGAAAYSLMISARDYGRFVAELAAPQRDPAAVRLMLTPQVQVDRRSAWALGLGRTSDASGVSYFQWGSNPGYSGLMLVYPDRHEGLVVLANNGKGADLGRRLAARLWASDATWRVPVN